MEGLKITKERLELAIERAALVLGKRKKHFPQLSAVHLNSCVESTTLELSYRADLDTGLNMLVNPKTASARLALGVDLGKDVEGVLEDFPDLSGDFGERTREAIAAGMGSESVGSFEYFGVGSAKELRRALAFAIPYQSTKAMRYNINCVLFEAVNGLTPGMNLVATNGHIMGVDYFPMVQGVGQLRSMLVPHCDRLVKLLPNDDRDVSMYRKIDRGNTGSVSRVSGSGLYNVTDTHVVFSWLSDESELDCVESVSIRLIDGQFPDYRQVFSHGEGKRYSFNRNDTLKQLNLFRKAHGPDIREENRLGVIVDSTSGKLRIAKVSDGYAVSASYLTLVLKSMREASFDMVVRENGVPIEFESHSGSTYGGLSRAIVMPICMG